MCVCDNVCVSDIYIYYIYIIQCMPPTLAALTSSTYTFGQMFVPELCRFASAFEAEAASMAGLTAELFHLLDAQGL